MPDKMTECPECTSTELVWSADEPFTFVLICERCGHIAKSITPDQVAEHLTQTAYRGVS